MLPTDEEITSICEAVKESPTPITARQACNRVFGTEKRTQVTICETVLRKLVADGVAFKHPPIRRKSPARYWHKDLVSRVASQIEQIVYLNSDPPTVNHVRSRIGKCDLPWFDEAVGRLINENRLYEITYRRARRLSARVLKADRVLTASDLQFLGNIVTKTAPCRGMTLTVEDVLRFLERGPGASLEGPAPLTLTESLLKEWYEEELPGLLGATSVPLPRTWNRYNEWCDANGTVPDLSAFHGILRRLAQDKAVELIPHSRSQPIPEGEKKILMKGPRGETIYFWRWHPGAEK